MYTKQKPFKELEALNRDSEISSCELFSGASVMAIAGGSAAGQERHHTLLTKAGN